MDRQFDRDRYRIGIPLLTYVEDETEEDFTINVYPGFSFGVYGIDKVERDELEEILSRIADFDGVVQGFCEEVCQKQRGVYGAENYLVGLAYITVGPGRVTMRYWGMCVNIELQAVFVKKGSGWEPEALYYQ